MRIFWRQCIHFSVITSKKWATMNENVNTGHMSSEYGQNECKSHAYEYMNSICSPSEGRLRIKNRSRLHRQIISFSICEQRAHQGRVDAWPGISSDQSDFTHGWRHYATKCRMCAVGARKTKPQASKHVPSFHYCWSCIACSYWLIRMGKIARNTTKNIGEKYGRNQVKSASNYIQHHNLYIAKKKSLRIFGKFANILRMLLLLRGATVHSLLPPAATKSFLRDFYRRPIWWYRWKNYSWTRRTRDAGDLRYFHNKHWGCGWD